MDYRTTMRVVRRLTAADGYLDLDMPQHALEELDSIDKAGSFEPSFQLLRGEALKAQRRYHDAIVPLERAVRLIPAPHNRLVWQSLSECYRRGGFDELADVAELVANSPAPVVSEITPIVNMTIEILKARESVPEA